MAAGSDEDDAEWAGPIERDVRSVAGWDGEGEGEGTPLEDEEEEADGDQIPLTLDALYRDGDVDPERPDDAGADDGTRGTDADDDATTCPVCFRPLRDLADTDAARLAHVNACLDDGGWRDEEDDGHPVSDESPPFAPSDTREDDDAIGATWDEGGEGEWHDVAAWLHAVDHGDFARIAVVARLTFAALEGCADESALAALGHVGDGARRRALLAAVDARRRGFAAPASAPTPKGGHPAAADASKGWHPTRAPAGVAPVFALARGERHAVRRPEPALEPQPQKRRRTGGGAVGGGAVAATAVKSTAGGGGPRPGRYVPPAEPPPPPPPWIRVPGTRFIVDGFQGYGKSHGGWWCRHWFLTHFHADHYRGLTKSTPPPGCLVWCSRPTAELCASRLGIQRDRLRAVDVGRSIVVDGVRCTFIDANHCPGAVMIVFDGIEAGPVLATGDCRFHPGMKTDPTLVALASRRPAVMLDTTYCSPAHVFPPQCEVLAAVRDAVKAESFNPRVLFLFGTYTIGKERVFFEAAKTLGKKVYVGKQKMKVLDALGSAIDDADRETITADDQATNLHVVPMGSTSFGRMKTILRYYKNRYDTIVAFKPTGWTFEAAKKHARATKRTQRGAMIQYSVPYSEHSSFDELRAFVKFLKPRAVLPHVGNDRGPKARRMVQLLTAPDEPADDDDES